MASSLVVTYDGDEYALDNYFKSLIFQWIMDSDLLKNEKNVLLVVSRKTIHFGKWVDYISNHQFEKMTGLNLRTLKSAIYQLESKGVLKVTHSNGGSGGVKERLNGYSLDKVLTNTVFKQWIENKESNGFSI